MQKALGLARRDGGDGHGSGRGRRGGSGCLVRRLDRHEARFYRVGSQVFHRAAEGIDDRAYEAAHEHIAGHAGGACPGDLGVDLHRKRLVALLGDGDGEGVLAGEFEGGGGLAGHPIGEGHGGARGVGLDDEGILGAPRDGRAAGEEEGAHERSDEDEWFEGHAGRDGKAAAARPRPGA